MHSRLAKNTKALSPVIATIILVAVTVAISIAVAAWLGALTVTYTGLEQLNITGGSFPSGTTATLSMSNTGTADVTIASVSASGGAFNKIAGSNPTSTTCTVANGHVTVPKGSSCSATWTFTSGTATFAIGTQYQFALTSTQGHTFLYSQIR